MKQELLTIKESAMYLNVSVSTMRRWAQKGLLKGTKVGTRGDWRFTTNDLELLKQDTPSLSEAVKKAEEQNQYQTNLLKSLSEAVYATDVNLTILSWNRAAEVCFKITEKEAVGKNLNSLIKVDFIDTTRDEAVTKLMKEGSWSGKVVYEIKKTGKRIPVISTGSVVKDTSGNVMGFVTANRDISELEASEKRFRSLIENSHEAIVLITDQGICSYASQSMKHVLGYTPEEYMQLDAASLVYPEDFEESKRFFGSILKSPGSTFTPYRIRYKHKDGTYRWIEYTATNARNDPSVRAIVFNFRDVTAQQKAEEQQQFLAQTSTILNSSIDYETTLKNLSKLIVPHIADYCRIVIVDEQKQIKEISVHHRDPKKITLVKELYNAYSSSTNDSGVGKLISTGEPEYISRMTPKVLQSALPKVLKLIKELHLQSYMGVPMKMNDKVVGAITFSSTREDRIYTQIDLAFAKELARRAALAIENAKLYTNAQKAIALRDDFISLASHELKTPVTSLKIYTHALHKQAEKQGEETFSKYLEKMNMQTDKLTVLINDLLNVSKLQHGKLEFTMENFDLNDLVKETVDAVQQIAERHIIKIKGEIDGPVFGDRYRIYQVLTNLLTNAIKYSPGANTIQVEIMPNGKSALVSVKDFGIGIDKEHQKHIFQQFYRVSSPTEKTYPGLGMGLYIAHEIVKRHGGEMTVESEKGKGSTFSFNLPYKG